MTSKENILLVGKKEFITYRNSLDMFFRKKNVDCVILKARGANIKKAIDLAEFAKNKGFEDLALSTTTSIYTVKFDSEGKEFSTSCIEIKLSK